MTSSAHILIHDLEQGSKKWLKLRSNLVTGSQALALLTRGAKKAIENNQKEFAGNFWTKRGHLLEEQSIELYERITGIDVFRAGFVTNNKYPNAGYSPDGITDIVLESKSFGEEKHLSINKEEDLPPEIIAQVQFGMLITELKGAEVLLYHPPRGKVTKEQSYKRIFVKPSKAIQDNIKGKLYAGFTKTIQEEIKQV